VDTIPNARSATAPLANVGAPPRVVAAALQRAKRTGSRYFNRRSTQSKILIYPGSSPGPPLCLRIQTAR
jgi:hypothetical protein